MCNFCEKLTLCPVWEKRTSVLDGNEDGSAVMEIVMDKYASYNDVFIHAEFTDKDGHWHNMSASISHCPFCGGNLQPPSQSFDVLG